jgi:hypothetical protein
LTLGHWLIDSAGRLIPIDFVNVWAAGRLALDGAPAAVYDWAAQKQAEVAALGRDFSGEFAWLYPPTFLFVAALLASLPYLPAFAAWTVLTFAAYVVAVRAVVGSRAGVWLAFAFPAALANFLVGQNGFVTAALLAGALIAVERRPILAGCLFGLLTFKPHLGLLIPLALLAGARWRVFGSAAASSLLLALAAAAAFGWGSWESFIHALPHAAQSTLTEGSADWSKLQSVFGLVRCLGGSDALAWSLQGAAAASCAAVVWLAWRSETSFDMKAATLAACALLATPYLYLYDLVVLMVPITFLVRSGFAAGFLRGEWFGIGLASLLIFAYPVAQAPLGLGAIILVAGLVVRRARRPARAEFTQIEQTPPLILACRWNEPT